MEHNFEHKFKAIITLENYHELIKWIQSYDQSLWTIDIQFYHNNVEEYLIDVASYAKLTADKSLFSTRTMNKTNLLGNMPITIFDRNMAIQFKLTWM